MKRKIAILMSAIMVATALPFSASAVEYKGDSVLNAGFPKANKPIDPDADDNGSIYGLQAGATSFSISDLKDRESALKFTFPNDKTSGDIPANTSIKVDLENGSFDDDLTSEGRYNYVAIANGKVIDMKAALTLANDIATAYSRNEATLTDYAYAVIDQVTDVRHSSGWDKAIYNGQEITNNTLNYANKPSATTTNKQKIENALYAITQSKNAGGYEYQVGGNYVWIKAKENGNLEIKYNASSSTNNGSNGTHVTLTGITSHSSGFKFDGSKVMDEDVFAGFVEFVSASTVNSDSYTVSTNTSMSALESALQTEAKGSNNLNLTTADLTSVYNDLNSAFYVPYTFNRDNDKTASVTVPVRITEVEATSGIVINKETALSSATFTSTGILKSNGSVITDYTVDSLTSANELTLGTISDITVDSTQTINKDYTSLTLPLGAVVADTDAPVVANVDGRYSQKVQNSKHTLTKENVSGSTSLVYPESSIKRFEDDTKLNSIVLQENARSTIGKNNGSATTDTADIFLRLSGGFKFKFDPTHLQTTAVNGVNVTTIKPQYIGDYIKDDSNNIVGWNPSSNVTATIVNDSTIKFTVTNLEKKEDRDNRIGFRFENLAVEPTNKDNYGNVTLNVSGDGINSESKTVAVRESLGFGLTTTTDPKNIVIGRHYLADNHGLAGTNDKDVQFGSTTSNGTMLEEQNTTVEIKFTEKVPNTLVNSRAIYFNVPDGVKIVGVDVYDAKNLRHNANGGEFNESNFEITNNGKTLELKKGEYMVESANQRTKPVEFKMKLDLSIDPAFKGEEIKLGVTGGGQSETVETVVAKAKQPFEVKTSTTKANMGYQEYNTANITITETAPGMFLENRDVELSLVAPYGTQELGFSNATYKVDGEELKIDPKSFKVDNKDKNSTSTIRFTIDKASHKSPNSITIENVKVGTTRSIPYGSYALGISGNAVINNYADYVKDNKDFSASNSNTDSTAIDGKEAQLVAQANTSRFEVSNYLDIITETGTFDKEVRVTVGEKTVLVGDQAVDMDVAPYIQASSNSTMVPLRFVSIALGVDSDSLTNPDESSKIAWDANTKTTTIYYGAGTGQKIIQFQAGSNIMTVDGTRIPMEYGVKAEIKDGRMFVPFRALGQALGVTVDWDPDTRTAIYNGDNAKAASTTTATESTTTTESTTESTTASTTTESTTASDSTTETTTAKN